ncbi:Similar to gammaCop: Coatomer subunit gamma (Drosophila pseudoobscura pseudoobscura) [Cotesia congregata]|uniref:Coatomer subunit gamma n=1 Tax=Cotesia congregata TaxID=51543 RepID=A0A8J2MXP9_COTCN|nr:Similar to gammaCop: Coatomer subunit gamma (Drosophila pseudoobscura pseudoobscura) [Cotesia congregata]
MNAFKRDKKEEEDGGGNPFQNLEKTTVLQEARTFNDTPVNPRKCAHILTKILYLLNQGEQLGTTEATEAFFAMTKLFQSRDVILRRLVYLGIKELSQVAEDVIIVTSSLTKDMTGKEDLYRAAAIRALCTITDGGMLAAIERYMKQAIVDKSPAVSSAALVSSLHLSNVSGDIARRWANEAQEALNSDNVMVQYHALGVLYQARKSDKHAVIKLVAKLIKNIQKSPYATCMLIRMACKLLDETNNENTELLEFIEACLRHKSEMVVYEAAHALVNLSQSGIREIAPAISVLQLFCGSPKAALRFAAVRTLNKVAMTHPAAVTACNLDLENLITDSNRSIATLAITTLLKTGAESSVDRLMKQIATFVSEISDEFKVVVVQAIRALCQKFPRKHSVLMNFLSAMLRDEGGLEYKAAIADTIIAVMEGNAEAKEAGLAHLCEFIEDCEHTSLAVRILHLLGQEGPTSKNPSRHIRFIYNRVILESASVRAAAVAALAHFAAVCPDLLPNVLVLLSRCQLDSDDEVRDRAAYYCKILKERDDSSSLSTLIHPPQLSIPSLERALHNYIQSPMDQPFDISQIPPGQTIQETNPAEIKLITRPAQPRLSREEHFTEKLSQVPQLMMILKKSPLFKSSATFELTESETEYNVKCIKHSCGDFLILQFDCLNTLSDLVLEDVSVAIEPPEGYTIIGEIPCPRLTYNEPGTTYTILQYPEDINSRTRGIDINAAWEAAPTRGFTCMEDTFALGANVTTLESAVQSLIGFLALEPADRTDKVSPGATSHVLFLHGYFRGGKEIFSRARLALAESQVTMQLSVRSQDPDVAALVLASVG